jgi:tetratricopeptide (TPR) repeat protein
VTRLALLLGLAAALAEGGSARTDDVPDVAIALRAGDYDAALAGLRALAGKAPEDAAAHRAYGRALGEVGRYREIEAVVDAFRTRNPRSAELWNTAGEALLAQGKREDAEAAFRKAIAGRATDALVAEKNLAVLRFDRGERAEATKGFERLIAAYNREERLSSEELAAVATACRYLGAEQPQLFKDALKAFDEAIAADPDNIDARVLLAELFLEKYNSADAATTLEQALSRRPSHPRALVALARLRDFDGAFGVLEPIERSLEVSPRLAEARVFRAGVLLAREDYAAAAAEAEGVLADNAAFRPALAVLAAARYLEGDRDRFDETRRKALALFPRDAELYTTLAQACVRNRLYPEAVAFAEQAVALDSRSWRGYGILGLNQLRTAAIEEGRRSLERSFAGDPYDVWIKNTLDLLDTFPGYVETTTAHFKLEIQGKESELLAPYAAELAEEAYERLAERYRYRPLVPVRVEVYPSHGDFSVRTVGLAGLGALGACFGPVLAIDSPSARPMGSFNWGSTLWHELAHTVTLGLTDRRIPRWLSEGLSVHEEHRARPAWGDDVSLEFLKALDAGELLPLRDLNDGFVRPKGPEQVAISYYQASLVADWIESERGFPAILDLLRAYRDGRTTAQAFAAVLGTSLEDFDRSFFAHLKERYAGPLAGLKEFETELDAGLALFQRKKLAEAEPHLERARALVPDIGGEKSPDWLLAQIFGARDEAQQAADALARLVDRDDSHYAAHLELAKLREERGDLAGAAAVLDRALYIWPFEPALHERLATLYGRLDDPRRVVRARRSLVALHQVDEPEAFYRLAVALLDAGDAAGARKEVLRALELAPRFQRAQELLLRLHRGAQPSGAGREGARSDREPRLR